ncbi:ATP-binding protein [Orientia tsutsugamushi]|uniref:ATP-binding protein n=1 Tax=Orientia tsutsugamushi TaxID=784 RepID=A0A2U3R0R2_ORITS|nr:ATP-binding protein [Orientia tsutsugamushi]KJV72374.1 histidine kinase-, DNA gyrase B-, and HSP90-like ATPase family protein [Orientia tsutsugamushi str. UT76]KJV77895.1 histidine kinase-, DNA gyrase B-, and HSP90-like ATPase family protein [Orientia tsutsugamushi str. UT76]SPR04240.1 ATP-binding protein [Orientia tsutsugamushi]SPR06814.1 ATP-binding protein [Orientia tsutsugamushi]SPR11778.1 ATP-binding protein [Orientia tsutsugamushi]
MPIQDEGQNKINKLTEKLSTEGINSTTIKQIDAELQKLYFQLEESGQVSIKLIDWIQYFRRIVNDYNKKKINIIASLNGIIFLFRQYIASTNIRVETFNIEPLINNTVIRMRKNFENINLNVQNDIKPILIGDSFRIKAVISQLIGSAVINSSKNSKIIVNVNQNSEILQFIVQNIGLSTSKEKLERINAELENTNLVMYQELGEGLAFIKHLTHQMKGNLRMKEHNNYVTFSFDVPTIV